MYHKLELMGYKEKDTKFGDREEGADLREVKREEWGIYDRNTLYGLLNELMRGGGGKKEGNPKTCRVSCRCLTCATRGETTYTRLSR